MEPSYKRKAAHLGKNQTTAIVELLGTEAVDPTGNKKVFPILLYAFICCLEDKLVVYIKSFTLIEICDFPTVTGLSAVDYCSDVCW